jgi:hypothetical protein
MQVAAEVDHRDQTLLQVEVVEVEQALVMVEAIQQVQLTPVEEEEAVELATKVRER